MIQPVRKIGTTRRSVSGVYAFRGEDAIPFESTLERDFIIKKEFFNNVTLIISQPCEIPFKHQNGRNYVYTPDFLVLYGLIPEQYPNYPKGLLIEVKPEKEWRKHWREWSAKWKAAIAYAKKEHLEFRIYDENRIRDEIYNRIRFLEQFKKLQFSIYESDNIIDTIKNMGSASIDYLLARHFMGLYRQQGYKMLWHLLATRKIDCDISQSLDDSTRVWVPERVR